MDSCDQYGDDEYDVYDDNHNGYNGYDDWLVKGLKSLFASPENNLWIPIMMVMMHMMFMMIIIMVMMIRMIGWSKG